MTAIRDRIHPNRTARTAEAAAPDLRVVNALLVLGIAAFFIGYLALNTQAAQKGFSIRMLEKRISELEDRRQRLDLSVVAGQSMQATHGRLGELGLVPVSSVDYVDAGAGAVAVK
jgi:hypothetical protein